MRRWIFVISGSDEEFQKRVKAEEWPIFEKTPNRMKLEVGDLMLFYKAGEDGQKFIGSATIKTYIKKHVTSKYILKMDEISVWRKPVAVRDVLAKLDFIENKEHWGRYFQGGVRPIPEKDWLAITDLI